LLAECMQGFERFSGESVRRFGLTHAQFDIIATLGNTEGMNYKELGERTLITKGTLTGVIERLEQKSLVARCRSGEDRRSFHVSLTEAGRSMFEQVFPPMVKDGRRLFSGWGKADYDALDAALVKLRTVITSGPALPNSPASTEEHSRKVL
jgi:MarR family 2-MHQ and catechol resistance regulon transcriptional repressor